MLRTSLITFLLLALSCASGGPKDDATIEDKCIAVEAKMLRKPWLERHNRRLFFLLDVKDKDRIIRAVAVNRENEAILMWAEQYLARAYDEGDRLRKEGKLEEADIALTVGICGEWVDKEWNEFQRGAVDFEMGLLAVYDIWSGRYLQIRTNFGDRWSDAVKGVDWKHLLWELGKKGAKGLVP